MPSTTNFSLSEYTFEEFCELQLEYVYGLRTDKGATRIYQIKEIGVERVLIHLVKRHINGGKGKTLWYFDNEEYPNVACLYEAYMKKACGV